MTPAAILDTIAHAATVSALCDWWTEHGIRAAALCPRDEETALWRSYWARCRELARAGRLYPWWEVAG